MAAAAHQGIGVFAGVALEREMEQRAIVLRPAPEQRGGEAADHLQHRADRWLLADLHVAHDLVAGQHALDQQFELAAGRLLAEQACLHHPGVVEHQQVARSQQCRQVLEDAVDGCDAGAVQQA